MPGSETGYAKNAANLKDLIIRLKTLGDDYQPPKIDLKIEALELFSKKNDELTKQLYKLLPAYRKLVDDQELTFKPLNKLITRSYNYLKAACNHPSELQMAKTLADKIRGVTKRKTSTAEGVKVPSQAQTSYDNRIAHLKQYIEVLSASNIYNPAETDIGIIALQSLLASIESSVTAVAFIKPTIDDLRAKRYLLFYGKQNGLIDTVLSIKNYIKASLKTDHAERKHILALEFKRSKM